MNVKVVMYKSIEVLMCLLGFLVDWMDGWLVFRNGS